MVPSAALCQQNSVGIRHGTIVVYEATPTQAIIVADSKLYDPQTKWSGSACKIINLSDDTLFFFTGNLFEVNKTGKTIFSQQTVARVAYAFFKDAPRTQNRLMEIANKYSALLVPQMNDALKLIKQPSDYSGLAGFASRDELNHPWIITVNISVTDKKNGEPMYAEPPQVSGIILNKQYMGDYPQYKPVMEFLDAKTPRGKLAMEKFKSRAAKLPESDKEVYELIAAVEAAFKWDEKDPVIGPPVDAVVIEPDAGIRWIKHKPKCSPQYRLNDKINKSGHSE